METRFFIDNGNRTAWRKTWFWQLGNWWIYYILSNYNTFSTLPYSLRATSCKWMRHLEKVAANSFRQSRLWLPRKLPHRKARCIFTHSAVFSIFSCIKWHIFKIILIVVKCWYDYWKKTYGKIIKNIVLYKAGLTTISTLSSQGDLGSTKYFGCKGPFNSPHLCTAFKWKVDLQEKLVGGTFIKEQMHNFKIVYAEARSPCCTQGTENIQSTWTRTRILPTIRTLILDFLDSLTVSWQSVSPLLLWKCSLFWQIVTLILLWKSWLEKENFWEITLWKENPTTRLSDEISPHFTKFIIENNFERHIQFHLLVQPGPSPPQQPQHAPMPA